MEAFKSILEVRDAGSKGKGVYSKTTIAAGTSLFELAGSLMNREDLAKYNEPHNCFQIGKDLFLSKSGDYDDYINHSCNPNCGLRILGQRGLLETLYQINPGDEITWDYSTTSTDTKETWVMPCVCGSYGCRKEISGFQYLPQDRKDYYIKLGVVPDYNKT